MNIIYMVSDSGYYNDLVPGFVIDVADVKLLAIHAGRWRKASVISTSYNEAAQTITVSYSDGQAFCFYVHTFRRYDMGLENEVL